MYNGYMRYMGKCTLENVMYHEGAARVVHDIRECTFPHIPHIAIVHLYNVLDYDALTKKDTEC